MKLLLNILWVIFASHASSAAATPITTGDGKGYVLTFQGRENLVGTKTALWDFEHPGFDDLDSQVTVSFRVRNFQDASNPNLVYFWTIAHPSERNFFQLNSNALQHEVKVLLHDNAIESHLWHHFAFTFKYQEGIGGTVDIFQNGVHIAHDTTTITTFKHNGIYLVLGCNPYEYYDRVLIAQPSQLFSGQIDSFMLHNRALSAEEVIKLSLRNPDPEFAALDDPSMVLYYTFDVDCGNFSRSLPSNSTAGLFDPECYISGKPVAKNYGVAGEKYDMLLDSVDNSLGFGSSWMPTGASEEIPIMPVASGRATYTTEPSGYAPHVYHVEAGGVISIPLIAHYSNGSDIPMSSIEIVSWPTVGNLTVVAAPEETGLVRFLAPAAIGDGEERWSLKPEIFTYRVRTDANRAPQQVHLWPLQRPGATSVRKPVQTIKEDTSFYSHWLNSVAVDPLGEMLGVKITELPEKGIIQQADGSPITEPGTVVNTPSGTVLYRPGLDGTGMPYANYSVVFFHTEVQSSLESEPSVQVISVLADNDLPTVSQNLLVNVNEDASDGVLVRLESSDVEGEPFGRIITKLPTKGKLYLTSDDTLSGNREHIYRVYRDFDAGLTFAQYAEEVSSVSSFWGAPLYYGYHAMGILGRPSCSTTGECDDERYNDGSDPIVGDRIRYNLQWAANSTQVVLVPAKVIGVRETETGESVFKILVHPVQRETSPGSYARCLPVGNSFPDDCDTTAIASKLNEDGEHIEDLVPRSALVGEIGAVWCPSMRKLDKDVRRVGGETAAAYGDQFMFDNTQEETWKQGNPPYTEFIEVTFETPVFTAGFVVGSPRGSGAVVSIKAKHSVTGKYAQVYSGLPLTALSKKKNEDGTYHNWEIPMCRTPFATNQIRIELDTESIADWNYIDYVQLLGATDETQPGFLRWPNQHVVYVPNPDAHGEDSFEFQATDCMGARFRTSKETSVVRIHIEPSNDIPQLTLRDNDEFIRLSPQSLLKLNQSQGMNEPLHRSIIVDIKDPDGDDVTISVIQLPRNAVIEPFLEDSVTINYRGNGIALESFLTINATAFDCKDLTLSSDQLILKIADASGTHSILSIDIQVDCTTLPRKFNREVVSAQQLGHIQMLNAFGITISVSWAIFNILLRKRKVVRFSSPPLNLVLLLG